METALRYGINTVTVVNNNQSFNQEMILWWHHAANEKNWKSSPVDYAAVAETFGLKSYRVERPSEFQPAIKDAVAAGRPALIDVQTDHNAVVPLGRSPPFG